MIYGILKDIKEGEYRVISTPAEVASIVAAGHEVWAEHDCGKAAGFPDEKYEAAGARIVQGIGPSFMLAALPAVPADLFGLPIDNILASSEIHVVEVRTLAPTSSDHLPVLLRFTIADGAPDPAAPARVAESVNAN